MLSPPWCSDGVAMEATFLLARICAQGGDGYEPLGEKNTHRGCAPGSLWPEHS
jgi:hypothetical protein